LTYLAEDMQDKEGRIQVRQHNAITNARHDLSSVQLDIYFMLLSLLRSGDDQNTKYEIGVLQIEEITGRRWNYQQLRDATAGLIGKVFEIEEKDGLLQVAMMSSAKYLKGKGKIQLTISEDLKPYLVDLKNNFTSFQLYCVLSMSSKYAKWMYVQFSRWKDIGYYSYELDDLKVLLNLKDPKGRLPEQYKQWGQFKDNVLEPAVRQINELSDINITFQVEKKGKSVHRINFTISQVRRLQTIIPFEMSDSDPEGIQLKNKMYSIGIQDNKIIKTILEKPEMRKKAHKWFYDYNHKKEEIKSPAGHFRTSIGI
jgi:plasmid replication initiation protein